jgi:hypothetical protein
MSSCSTEGAVALEPVIEHVKIEIERERAPYCVPSEGCCNHFIYFTIDVNTFVHRLQMSKKSIAKK